MAAFAGLILCALSLLSPRPAEGASETFVVDTNVDTAAQACTAAADDCSLRGAITRANATPDFDTITIGIDCSGVRRLNVNTPLPDITQPVLLDGYSCAPATANTAAVGANGNADLRVGIEPNPGGSTAVNGLRITGNGSTVRGFILRNWTGTAVLITGNDNTIEGNFIGTNSSGNTDNSNGSGIAISGSNNTVGAPAAMAANLRPGARNVIAGNFTGAAVLITGGTGNAVSGNHIGIGEDGATGLANGQNVAITGGSGHLVGGDGTRANIIGAASGAVDPHGIRLANPLGDNTVSFNRIGTNGAGSAANQNDDHGILITNSPNNVIGPDNLISGNDNAGIQMSGAATTGNTITGNRIGTSLTGLVALPNSTGIAIDTGASNNVITANTVSGNTFTGVFIFGSTSFGNVLKGNFIGANGPVFGANPAVAFIPNGLDGILLDEADSTIIGGTGPGEANTISGNLGNGITLVGGGGGADFSQIVGNRIGTDASGTFALPNQGDAGIAIQSFSSSTVVQANVISGNAGAGVRIEDGASFNSLRGNFIGTNATGTAPLPNQSVGVRIASNSNTIGGPNPGDGNVISGNDAIGVFISGNAPTGNKLIGNMIGTNAAGSATLQNAGSGVVIDNSVPPPVNTEITSNTISGNFGTGISIQDGSQITIKGNKIGVGADGLVPIPNAFFAGISVEDADNVTIGGTTASDRNIISSNTGAGIDVGNTTILLTIQGNYIGLGGDGTTARPNTLSGISIGGFPGAITIGGAAPGAGNVISSNGVHGISSTPTAEPFPPHSIKGNKIGVAADGVTARGNTGMGLNLAQNGAAVVGGTAAGEANVIAFNGSHGVGVDSASPKTIRGNSIHTNGGSGIAHLAPAGVFPPTINASGAIGGTACNNCTVDVYSDSADEGRIYHGSAVANGAGVWSFAGAVTGPKVTATVTNGQGRTSVFSAPRTTASGFKVNVPTDDPDPTPGDGVCRTAASATDCTLRAAIQESNALPGLQVVSFSSDCDPCVIAVGSDLPTLTEPVTIDGYSHPDASANTLAVGNNAVIVVVLQPAPLVAPTIGLRVSGDSTIRGLAVRGFVSNIRVNGAGNLIEGNFLGIGPDGSLPAVVPGGNADGITVQTAAGQVNTIGGTTPAARNVISGNAEGQIDISETSGPTVIRGNYIGTNPQGTAAVPNASFNHRGVLIRGNGSTVGGGVPGAGNLISGNTTGIDFDGNNNIIQGNVIGLNAAGTAALPNGSGILGDKGSLAGLDDTIIGGSLPGEGNVISGNTGPGIFLTEQATRTIIRGNKIGVRADGATAAANGSVGVILSASDDSTIGGEQPGEDNVIAFNSRGIQVAGSGIAAERNRISGNSIHSNVTIGIELTGAGANGGISPPVVLGATLAGVAGTSCNDCVIEVFSDTGGQGRTFHGSATASPSGIWAFLCQVACPPPGPNITATATDAQGNTSQFSLPLQLQAVPVTLVVNATGDAEDLSTVDGLCLTASGVCTLRAALQQADAAPDQNEIHFNIPGADPLCSGGVCTILTFSSLPGINEPTLIDGYTQPGASANTADVGTNAQIKVSVAPAVPVSSTMTISSDVTLRGLAFPLGGLRVSNGGTIVGCFIGTSVDGLSSGGAGGAVSGVRSTNNQSFLGGPALADRNLIGGLETGVSMTSDAGFLMRNNLIGTDRTGLTALPGQTGIGVDGAATSFSNDGALTLGGLGPGEGNVIGGWVTGINVGARTFVALGNFIGVSADGSADIPNGNGIVIGGTVHAAATIGGTAPGAGNTISANTGAGVRLEGSATGAAARTIRGNSIFLNGAEGILRTLGAEADVAPPVVLDATADEASGTACPGCIVEVFTDFDDEGFTFHGSTTANGTGAWTFFCQVACPFPEASLTATATNADGNTSMFSAPLVLDLTVTFDLFAGATGQLWTGTPIPLADLETFPGVSLRAFTQVTAVFHWDNNAQQFQFWFRGFPIGFQTLAGGLETGKFYFFQSPTDGTVGIPNGNLFTLPQPGGSFSTFAGATGQLWSGTDIPMAELDDAPPAGLPPPITALFFWSNESQRFDFWFRGFPDAFQTLVEGIVRGRFYFFQSNQQGVQVPLD